MDQEKIGKFIANLRKEEGLNQGEFGELFNVTDKAVSNWETGKALPDIQILLEMSKRYNLTINDILGRNNRIKKTNYKLFISIILLFLVGFISLAVLIINYKPKYELNSLYSNNSIYNSYVYNIEDDYYFGMNFMYSKDIDVDAEKIQVLIKYDGKVIYDYNHKGTINLYEYLKDLDLGFKISVDSYFDKVLVLLKYKVVETEEEVESPIEIDIQQLRKNFK